MDYLDQGSAHSVLSLFTTRPEYPASTCTLRKGKYYVSVTVPKQIEPLFKNKQIRRSTGTSDFALAKQRQHALADEIYRYMDEVWKDAYREWKAGLKDVYAQDAAEFAKSLGVYREGFSADRMRRFLDEEAQQVLTEAHTPGGKATQEQTEAATEYLLWETMDEREWQKLQATKPTTEPQKAGDDTIKGVLPTYLDGRNWTRQKTRDAARRQIERFVDMIGNLKLDQIEKSHAYDYAQALDDAGYAHKTIRSSVSAISTMLEWCERKRLVKLSPFVNLKLANYGTAAKSYRPFEKSELHQIFSQGMPAQERTLMSILITTGMRLDEAALLTWERVKEVDGIRYISLFEEGSGAVIVKNSQSNRLVALPDCLRLPERGSGRLFDYRADRDGKAENAASRALMKVIRQVTDDKMKVVHSLRGTLKDLLRDAGVTKEVNDFITGHSQGDEAGKYGSGPSLETKYKAVNAVEHPWLVER